MLDTITEVSIESKPTIKLSQIKSGKTKISLIKDGKEIGRQIFGPDKREKGGIYAQDLYVDKDQRGKGYGRRLLQTMEAIAQENGFTSISFEVDASKELAIALYKSENYQLEEEIKDKKGIVYYRMVKDIHPVSP